MAPLLIFFPPRRTSRDPWDPPGYPSGTPQDTSPLDTTQDTRPSKSQPRHPRFWPDSWSPWTRHGKVVSVSDGSCVGGNWNRGIRNAEPRRPLRGIPRWSPEIPRSVSCKISRWTPWGVTLGILSGLPRGALETYSLIQQPQIPWGGDPGRVFGGYPRRGGRAQTLQIQHVLY